MLNPSHNNISALRVWLDGQLLPADAAFLPAHSQGHLWGRGLFETIAVHGGQPFALTRHLARLRDAAPRLALQLPDDATLHAAIAALLVNCPKHPQRLRLSLTGGETPGLALDPEPGHLLLQLTPAPFCLPEATMLTVPWRRNEFSPLAGVKSTSYAENAVALAWASQRGATEALFLNTAGELCEGAVSNLFLVRHGAVFTPFADAGCLPGITRSLVLELCRHLGLEAHQKALTPADLSSADQVFITNSIRGIVPVLSVDHDHFDAPGPITTALTDALIDLRNRLPDP